MIDSCAGRRRHLGRTRVGPTRVRAGVSLVEVLVACMVLSVAVLGILGTSNGIAQQMGGGMRQTVAMSMAQARIDSLSSISCAGLSGVASGSSTKRGVQETWTVTDGVNIKTIAVVLTIPKRANPVTITTMIPCKD